jgi:hypothetical protein
MSLSLDLGFYSHRCSHASEILHFDNPLGTGGDDVNLLLVALATRAAVDAIATAFDWYHRR